MVLAVRNWAFGVPRPLGLVEPATRTGVRRLGGVERVTNPWERVYNQGRGLVWVWWRLGGVERVTNPWERVYNQGRGSVWGLQAPSRGFGSRSNKVFIYLNIPTLSRGTVV